MKKLFALLLIVVLSMSVLAGCAKKAEPVVEEPKVETPAEEPKAEEPVVEEPATEEPAADGEAVITLGDAEVLRLLEASDIPSLDTNLATDSVSFTILGNVMEGLFTVDEKDQIVPGVCESYEVSADGKTYTFKLRQNSVWSNGTPVTAKDFVYSWRRLANPATAAEYAYLIETAGIKNGSAIINKKADASTLGVTAIDDYTLEVQLEVPAAYYLSLMSFPSFFPLNEEFLTAQGAEYGTSVEKTIFNGAYTLANWQKGYGHDLVKNDMYWDKDKVDIETVSFRIIKETNTAVNMYEADEIDRVGLSAEYVDKFKDDPNFTRIFDSAVFYLQMNQIRPIMANVNFRKALSFGVDKTFLTEKILNNGSLPADYFVPVGLAKSPVDGADFREDSFTYNSFDKAKAQEFLAKAKTELGMETFEVEILGGDSDTHKKISEYIAEQLEANLPGVKVTLNTQPFENKLELEKNHEYDISIAGWGPDYSDPMTFMDMFVTGGGLNKISYSNPAYDALIASCKTGELATDLAGRWEALIETERLLLEEDAAVIPLYQRAGSSLIRPYIINMTDHLVGSDFIFKFTQLSK